MLDIEKYNFISEKGEPSSWWDITELGVITYNYKNKLIDFFNNIRKYEESPDNLPSELLNFMRTNSAYKYFFTSDYGGVRRSKNIQDSLGEKGQGAYSSREWMYIFTNDDRIIPVKGDGIYILWDDIDKAITFNNIEKKDIILMYHTHPENKLYIPLIDSTTYDATKIIEMLKEERMGSRLINKSLGNENLFLNKLGNLNFSNRYIVTGTDDFVLPFIEVISHDLGIASKGDLDTDWDKLGIQATFASVGGRMVNFYKDNESKTIYDLKTENKIGNRAHHTINDGGEYTLLNFGYIKGFEGDYTLPLDIFYYDFPLYKIWGEGGKIFKFNIYGEEILDDNALGYYDNEGDVSKSGLEPERKGVVYTKDDKGRIIIESYQFST